MLSPREYESLKKYQDNKIQIPENGLSNTDVRLKKAGYLSGTDLVKDSIGFLVPTAYTISEEGLDQISEYEQARADVAMTRNQITYQNIILTATLILSGISVIIALLPLIS